MKNPAQNHIPLARIQKLIGQRMLEAKRRKCCFYIESKADVTEMMAIRPRLRKSMNVKITTNAFYICALALAAAEYRRVVSKLDCDNGSPTDSINVGFAVNAPHGLVVPVIKQADKKSLAEIARIEKMLTEQARDNKLQLEQMQGETIALSNLGPYGIDSFLAITPPPANIILAVGNVIPAVICIKSEAAVRRMVSLTLAVDYGTVDAVYAARFLTSIKEKLENPLQLI